MLQHFRFGALPIGGSKKGHASSGIIETLCKSCGSESSSKQPLQQYSRLSQKHQVRNKHMHLALQALNVLVKVFTFALHLGQLPSDSVLAIACTHMIAD